MHYIILNEYTDDFFFFFWAFEETSFLQSFGVIPSETARNANACDTIFGPSSSGVPVCVCMCVCVCVCE